MDLPNPSSILGPCITDLQSRSRVWADRSTRTGGDFLPQVEQPAVARDSFLLRTDPQTLNALRRWAEEELRSVNGQIDYLLRQALRDAGRLEMPGECPPDSVSPEPPAPVPNPETKSTREPSPSPPPAGPAGPAADSEVR